MIFIGCRALNLLDKMQTSENLLTKWVFVVKSGKKNDTFAKVIVLGVHKWR